MPSVRRVKWAKFRVTVVSLVAVIILGVLLYLLAGGMIFHEKATLYLYVPDATGLYAGLPVRVDGIDVGKVRSVALSGSAEPNRVVRVAMTIERGQLANIPADSNAQISADTMVGDKFVDVSSGTSPNRIRPDGEIIFQAQPDLMRSLDLRQFDQQLRIIDATMRDIEEARSPVGQFIMGREMYDDLRRRIDELERGFRQAIDTTRAVGQAIYSDELFRSIHDPLAQLDQTLALIDSGQGPAGRLLRDTAQYQELLAGTQNLRRSIAGLRAAEFFQSDALYTDLSRSVTSLIRSVDDFNADPLMSTTEMSDNLNGFARELQDTVRDFRGDPRKYLRIKVF